MLKVDMKSRSVYMNCRSTMISASSHCLHAHSICTITAFLQTMTVTGWDVELTSLFSELKTQFQCWSCPNRFKSERVKQDSDFFASLPESSVHKRRTMKPPSNAACWRSLLWKRPLIWEASAGLFILKWMSNIRKKKLLSSSEVVAGNKYN